MIVSRGFAGQDRGRALAALALAGLAAGAFFAFDVSVPLGMAGGLPYIAVVLAAFWLPWTFAPFALAAAGTLLTVAGYYLSPPGGVAWVAYANRGLAVAAIWIAAGLVFRGAASRMAAQASAAQLRALIDTAADAIIIIDAEGIVQIFNPASKKLFGFEAEEVVGRNVKLLMPPPYRDEHDDYLKRYWETGEARIIGIGREVVCQRKDGTTFPADLSVGETRMSGQPVAIGIIRDLTGRKQAEEDLRRQALVWRQMSEGVLIVEPDGRIIDWNTGAEKLFGYAKEEMLGRYASETHVEDVPGTVRAAIVEAIESEGQWSGEINMRRKDGVDFVCEVNVMPMRDDNGDIVARVGVIRDITERRRMESARRRLAAIVESSEDAIVGTTLDGTVTEWNAGAQRIFGYAYTEMIGKPISQLVSGDRRDQYREIAERIKDGAPIDPFETVCTRKDGTPVDVSITISPIREARDRVVAAAVIIREITEMKRAAAIQRQATKMEALGQLAAGVAHDFNNILFPIATIAADVEDSLPDGSEQKTNLKKVLLAAERGRNLVEQILAFTRQQPVERRLVAIDEIVAESVSFLTATTPATIEITCNFEDKNLLVHADPTQIHEVIMNLVTNAVQAIGAEPGVIEISLRRKHVDGEFSVGAETLPPGTYVKLTVTDNGSGMDQVTLERLFDPYFTTKSSGEGTGMGLAVVQGIITSHRGAITATSEPQQGTTFSICLPAAGAS